MLFNSVQPQVQKRKHDIDRMERMRTNKLFACIAAVILGTGSAAQAQITITPNGDGAATTTGVLNMVSLPSSPILFNLGNSNFRPSTPASIDQMFQHFWGFRGNADARNYWFCNNVGGGVACTAATVGNNLGTLNSGGVDGNAFSAGSAYNFDYAIRWKITHDGVGPNVLTWITITNQAAAPLVINLFNFADIDINATAAGDIFGVAGGGTQFNLTDAGSNMQYVGFSADRFQADTAASGSLRNAYNTGGLLNLTNTVAGSGVDFTGMFQWSNRTIAPGGSIKVFAAFSFGRPAAGPCAGDANNDGVTDAADLSVLLGQFGSAVPVGSGADFNNDALVNSADLSVLLSSFGCS